MNKEHVFQIGISVDEDEIVYGINEQVKNVILKNISIVSDIQQEGFRLNILEILSMIKLRT